MDVNKEIDRDIKNIEIEINNKIKDLYSPRELGVIMKIIITIVTP